MNISVQAIHKYLSPTNNWIYNQFINFKNFDYLVIANSIQSSDIFPVEKNKLILFPKIKAGELPLIEHILRAIKYRIFVSTGIDNCYFYHKLKKYNITVIHAHFANNAYKYLPLVRKLKVPFIISYYGYDYDMLPRKYPIWNERYQVLFKSASAIICEGEYGRQQIIKKGCAPEKVFVNHLGINVNKIPFLVRKWNKGEVFKICQIASFVPKKGHEYTVKAFASFLEIYSNAHLTLVGTGILLSVIKRLIKNLNIQNKVTFIEHIPYNQLYHELLKYHLFIHPSITDEDGDCEGGAPVILLDAQATGLPVISTLHCDIPEEVIDGKSGFLVPEKDIVQMVLKMQMFIDNSNLLQTFGYNGRRHVSNNYNTSSTSLGIENIYKNVIVENKL